MPLFHRPPASRDTDEHEICRHGYLPVGNIEINGVLICQRRHLDETDNQAIDDGEAQKRIGMPRTHEGVEARIPRPRRALRPRDIRAGRPSMTLAQYVHKVMAERERSDQSVSE